MATRVFLVTGCSSGFGHELVKTILKHGDIAIATARNASNLNFPEGTPDTLLTVDLDVTSQDSIKRAFDTATKKFNRIDVVVNNAGFGLCGEFESYTNAQIRKQFDVNFFGLVDVTRTALETMREHNKPQGGLIQQVTSIGGQVGIGMVSIYNASKWAVEGFTEAIAQEVKPEWGIKFTCIEPGGFRTKWAGNNMEFGAQKSKAYDHIDGHAVMAKRDGTQPGDPAKAAHAMYELAVGNNPPLRCVLGSDAYARMIKKLDDYTASVKEYEKLSNSTDVD